MDKSKTICSFKKKTKVKLKTICILR